tara:strand:+ start:7444 stop:9147 length:1704 start_codon:yes stop_codon:yes gene_type:complete
MNKSILFFDATTKLVNPQDEFFIGENTRELLIDEDTLIDEVLTTIINDNLLEEEYTNIILPACFGAILSNFIGLRLATQIRCTPGVNQTSNIFLYSFTGIQDYFNNECFNILKTTGVSLIDYDIQTILNCFNKQQRILSPNNLKQQVSNLKLDVPLNYADSHSVANEWAIYRWANALNTSDNQILKIETKLENDLYFKYLKAINPVSEIEEINLKELKLNFSGDPKVLYIDDEAEKGWWEIFCKILDDENEIFFSHLDDEFNQKNQNEIIDISLNKVIEEKIDIVILDLRLHKEDFNNKPINEITGFKILEKIKNHNKGIQVIIFSATNKIWNLQALQNAGADGFIIKESPNNNYEPGFTKQSIEKMLLKVDECLDMIFLKDVYNHMKRVKKHLQNVSNNTGEYGLEEGLVKMKFKNEISIQLDIIYDCLSRTSKNISSDIRDENSYLNLSFISIFKIIELINDYFTDETGNRLKSNSKNIQKYNQQTRQFVKIAKDKYPTTRDKISSIIHFELNITLDTYTHKLNKFIKIRNNIIHPKTLKDYKKTTKQDNVSFLSLLCDLIMNVR